MIQIRKSEERGHANHGWLDSHHTFSFGSYFDPRHTGFHDLIVINEDRVEPGAGFGKHGHKNMEIVSYVLEGALEHKDSMGTGSVLRPGDVQRMSAGTGVQHSEFNHSKSDPLHFLQIWITPSREGNPPGYEEKRFTPEEKANRLKIIVSPDGREGSITIHQDALIHAAVLDAAKEVVHPLRPGRKGWVQVVRGSIDLNGHALEAGDGAAITVEDALRIRAIEKAELLVFDLP